MAEAPEWNDWAGALESVGLTEARLAPVARFPGGTWFAAHGREGARLVRALHRPEPGALDLETRLCAHLRNGGFPTPSPLGSSSATPDAHVLTAFPVPPGELRASAVLSTEAFWRLGMTLAKLHHLANAFSGAVPRFDPDAAVRALEPLAREGDERARSLLPKLVPPSWGLAPEGPFLDGLEPSEVRWLGDDVSELLGLHRVRSGPWVLGLAQVLADFCLEAEGAACTRALMDGYGVARRLSKDERTLLARLVPYAASLRTARRLEDPRLRDSVRSSAEVDEVALTLETALAQSF